ncbi:hypothetical protein ACIRQQ_02635 [Streptomyces fuscichromogenes]|uniref:hypothetical protein n=1 Tax=Streptomyces fuscichromogenes TaxID=1324013 RepID=UPI00382F1C76
MKYIFRTHLTRFCATATALLAVGLLGQVHGGRPERPEHARVEATCEAPLRCDDTSWGG